MKQIITKETMTSLEIAEITGKQHAHVMRDIRNLLEQGVSESNFGLSSYKQGQPNGGTKDVPCFVLTKKGCLILASGYDALLREKIIDRWEELETGKAAPCYITTNKEDEVKARMVWVKGCKELLNLNDSSTLKLMKDVAAPLGLPSPDYVPSKGLMHSATALLKKHGVKMSSAAFNKVLEKFGIIERKTREGRTGKIHKWAWLPDKHSQYGENVVSPECPNQTQIQWYDDRFLDVLDITGIKH